MDDSLLSVEKSLEYKFLYESDADSLHLLLSMLAHRYCYNNLRPRYTLMKKLNTALKRSLVDRRDREYVILALRRLINDDVNRFEMAMVVDAYSLGHHDNTWVNQVERCAVEQYDPEELSRMCVLFQNQKDGRAMGLKSKLFFALKEQTNQFSEIKHFSDVYCRRVLKKKIYRLNEHLDKQIVVDFEDLSRLKLEENNLTLKEPNHVYTKCNQYLYDNVTKVYKEAYWNGINDAVLKRYSG